MKFLYSFIFKFFKRKKIEVKQLPQAESKDIVIDGYSDPANIFLTSFQEVHDKLDAECERQKLALLNNPEKLKQMFNKLWNAVYFEYKRSDMTLHPKRWIIIGPMNLELSGSESKKSLYEAFCDIFKEVCKDNNLLDKPSSTFLLAQDSEYIFILRDKYEQMLQTNKVKYQIEIDEKMRKLLRQGIYR